MWANCMRTPPLHLFEYPILLRIFMQVNGRGRSGR
ncbi:hypothetical protein BACCAP_03078 [Pseudoflavonifractor capillosus ATCC 29799]|uniref:Uncharacterized protein n=1 Tax=Pseudoflavonifractor capillosus ATCC 29799 TaxID=411467 RepID=A6NXY3_9FIRM|nr:hypothetical protein BACCAP_03078 [Pseudoflavonifractor capillosus ATCC 29799]